MFPVLPIKQTKQDLVVLKTFTIFSNDTIWPKHRQKDRLPH